MVTIRVSDSAIVGAGEEAESEEFSVPRAFLCSQSKYFERAFETQWSEGQSKRLEIDDVAPWIFRVFIGWLFYQNLFYDEQRVDPEPVPGEKQHDSSKDRASTDNTEAECENHEEVSHAASSGNQISTESRAQTGCQAQKRYTPDGDYQDPRTWTWMDLFKLYSFAEKYDTRILREQVFDVIQHRLLYWRLVEPRPGKGRPTPESLSYLVDNMPGGASIIEMLAVWYMQFGLRNLQHNLAYFERLPSRFLALCYLRGLRHHLAANCQTCLKGEETHGRELEGHAREDGYKFSNRDPCEHHEHGEDDAETSACKQRWARRIAHYLSKSDTEFEMCD